MRNKLDREEIRRLHSLGLNDNEIARELKASVNGVRYIRKDILGLDHNVKTYPLTQAEKEIIAGTLLGDACITYIHKHCRYPQYSITHCETQKEYILMLYNELRSIMTDNITYYDSFTAKVKGKEYECQPHYSIRSHNCDSLVEFRQQFYCDNKKIIPVDFIKDIFSSKSLAYWYLDDGSYDKRTNSYVINTQAFQKENLMEFTAFLKEKFNLEFTIKKDNSLYLRHSCNSTFISLIESFVPESMQYKIRSSLNSAKQGTASNG